MHKVQERIEESKAERQNQQQKTLSPNARDKSEKKIRDKSISYLTKQISAKELKPISKDLSKPVLTTPVKQRNKSTLKGASTL